MSKKAKAAARPKLKQTPVAENDPDIARESEEFYGARRGLGAPAKRCLFCKHVYLKPCSDKTKDSCPNFIHLQSRSKKR